MPTHKDQQPPKARSAARAWSRVEAIDRQIAKLEAERAEIVPTLQGVLDKQKPIIGQ
jgi:hypothetical protein